MFGLHMLSFNLFYVLYLLLITIRRPVFGLTLDINNEKYTKLSVVLFFPVVLRVANFLLPYFCSVVSLLCRKPVVRIFSTNYARCYCSQFGGVVCLLYGLLFLLQLCQRFLLLWLCIKLLGNVVRVYPRIIQGLASLSV